MTGLLAAVRARLATDPRARAVDLVYDTIDPMLLEGRTVEVEAILRSLVGAGLPRSVLLSAKIVCTPWRDQLGEAWTAICREADAT